MATAGYHRARFRLLTACLSSYGVTYVWRWSEGKRGGKEERKMGGRYVFCLMATVR
jgi:hypothetical protein